MILAHTMASGEGDGPLWLSEPTTDWERRRPGQQGIEHLCIRQTGKLRKLFKQSCQADKRGQPVLLDRLDDAVDDCAGGGAAGRVAKASSSGR